MFASLCVGEGSDVVDPEGNLVVVGGHDRGQLRTRVPPQGGVLGLAVADCEQFVDRDGAGDRVEPVLQSRGSLVGELSAQRLQSRAFRGGFGDNPVDERFGLGMQGPLEFGHASILTAGPPRIQREQYEGFSR